MYGYRPVQYNSAPPNSQFWGRLLNDQWQPSELFCRLSDSIFFYLDQNAQTPYPNTGYIEPDKQLWWSQAMGLVDAVSTEYVGKNAMSSLYDVAGIPYTLAQVKNGNPIPILDRQGFLHSLISKFRIHPMGGLEKCNKSVAIFGLTDPATGLRFPGPIPAIAVPVVPDWALKMALTNWQTSTILNYRRAASAQAIADIQKKQQRSSALHLVSGAVNMLSGGGLGGGITGFGF